MGRPRSRKKKLKAPGDKILVKSIAYPEHWRARRGVHTYAGLNEALKENGLHMIGSNRPARLIQNALKPFRENFPGGLLWQRLLKHFTAQARKNHSYSVDGINFWDVNKQYLTSRLMNPDLNIKKDSKTSQLIISLNYAFSNRFMERKGEISGFQVTIILLFPNFVRDEIITIPTVLPEKKLADDKLYSFVVQIPAGAESFIACFKAEACVNGVPAGTLDNVGKAMSLVKSGMIDAIEEIGEPESPEPRHLL